MASTPNPPVWAGTCATGRSAGAGATARIEWATLAS
jgi:hypothetical protein